jgi:hypothetical protein
LDENGLCLYRVTPFHAGCLLLLFEKFFAEFGAHY